MQALYPIPDGKLEWRSAAGVGRRYELHADRGVIADLDFGKKVTKEAVGRTVVHTWRIKPDGPMGSRYIVRREGDEKPFSTFRFNLARTKGVLPIPGTRHSFHFVSTNFFATDWQWLDQGGAGLIGLRQKGLSRVSADVFLGDEARQHPLTPLFFLLGFYLVYLNHERHLAAANENTFQLENLARSLSAQRRRTQRQAAVQLTK